MSVLLSKAQVRSLVSKLVGEAAKTVAGSTNASPSVINVTAHGYSTGDVVAIYNAAGNTAINGLLQITVTDADHFTAVDLNLGTAINGNGVQSGTVKVNRVASGLFPSDMGDIQATLNGMSYVHGSDNNRSVESNLKTIFGV